MNIKHENDIIEFLKTKNLGWPSLEPSNANYLEYKQAGNLIFISGQTPLPNMGCVHQGKVGQDLTKEEAYLSAQNCALQLLKVLSIVLNSDFTKLKQIVKVTGMVACSSSFYEQGQVINGCSDLLCAVFGKDIATHARFSIGVCSLPGNAPVEIEMIVEVN